MAKVSAECLKKLSQSQKDLNAWRLNWILGREFYRAKQDAVSMAYWDGLAWSNYPSNPNFKDEGAELSAYRKLVKPGFEANTPGWDNTTCTLDVPALACFAFWMAASSDAVRQTAVALMQQYEADLPYLKTSCPSEVTEDPQYAIEVPPVGTTPGTTIPGTLPGEIPPGTIPPGTTPGTTTTTTTPPPGGEGTPVKVEEETPEKKINWWLWGGIGAAVLGGAALIGALRDPEYVYDQPSQNPARRKAVAKHGGYVWSTAYQTWTDEDIEAGDTDNRGFEHERSRVYKSLQDLISDVRNLHNWIGWSDGIPSGMSYIVSSDHEENRAFFEKGERTSYALFIQHADGSQLTKDEVRYVNDKLKLRGRV